MGASVVKAFHDAMKTMDMAAILTILADDLIVVEPASLPYGGTTSTRKEFFDKVFSYTNERASFRVDASEVFGDGNRLAGHFTARFTAHRSGETFVLNQTELYDVTAGVISKVEVFQYNTNELIEFLDRNQPVT